jgi:hypothetical protein
MAIHGLTTREHATAGADWKVMPSWLRRLRAVCHNQYESIVHTLQRDSTVPACSVP